MGVFPYRACRGDLFGNEGTLWVPIAKLASIIRKVFVMVDPWIPEYPIC